MPNAPESFVAELGSKRHMSQAEVIEPLALAGNSEQSLSETRSGPSTPFNLTTQQFEVDTTNYDFGEIHCIPMDEETTTGFSFSFDHEYATSVEVPNPVTDILEHFCVVDKQTDPLITFPKPEGVIDSQKAIEPQQDHTMTSRRSGEITESSARERAQVLPPVAPEEKKKAGRPRGKRKGTALEEPGPKRTRSNTIQSTKNGREPQREADHAKIKDLQIRNAELERQLKITPPTCLDDHLPEDFSGLKPGEIDKVETVELVLFVLSALAKSTIVIHKAVDSNDNLAYLECANNSIVIVPNRPGLKTQTPGRWDLSVLGTEGRWQRKAARPEQAPSNLSKDGTDVNLCNTSGGVTMLVGAIVTIAQYFGSNAEIPTEIDEGLWTDVLEFLLKTLAREDQGILWGPKDLQENSKHIPTSVDSIPSQLLALETKQKNLQYEIHQLRKNQSRICHDGPQIFKILDDLACRTKEKQIGLSEFEDKLQSHRRQFVQSCDELRADDPCVAAVRRYMKEAETCKNDKRRIQDALSRTLDTLKRIIVENDGIISE